MGKSKSIRQIIKSDFSTGKRVFVVSEVEIVDEFKYVGYTFFTHRLMEGVYAVNESSTGNYVEQGNNPAAAKDKALARIKGIGLAKLPEWVDKQVAWNVEHNFKITNQ